LTKRENNILFHEVQKIRNTRLGFFVLVVILVCLGLMLYGLAKQSGTGVLNSWDIVVGLIAILFFTGFIYLSYAMKLTIEVGEKALYIRFFPLSGRNIEYKDIKSCNVRMYLPIGEYGGWGIRFGANGRAYNVSGDKGVQLELAQEKRLLLGSQRADELADAINAIRATVISS